MVQGIRSALGNFFLNLRVSNRKGTSNFQVSADPELSQPEGQLRALNILYQAGEHDRQLPRIHLRQITAFA